MDCRAVVCGIAVARHGRGLVLRQRVPTRHRGLFGSLFKGIGKRANGGYTAPGNYLVGERGPELLSVGATSHVTNNAQLRGLRGSAGGVNITFGPITSNDPEAVRRMAAEAVMAAIPMINKQSSDYTMSRLGRRTL